MSESIINFFVNLNLPKEVITIIISMLPIVEIRGSLPVAISILKMSWMKAYILSVIGNVLIVPFLMLFLEKFTDFLMKYKFFAKCLNWWFERAKKNQELMEKYEALGLLIFVAIPLPGTGAWTGAVLAYLFNIKKRIAFFMILFGVIIAGLIVLLITLGLLKIF